MLLAYCFMHKAHYVEQKLQKIIEIGHYKSGDDDPIAVPENTEESLSQFETECISNNEYIESENEDTLGTIMDEELLDENSLDADSNDSLFQTLGNDSTNEIKRKHCNNIELKCYLCNGMEFSLLAYFKKHQIDAHMALVDTMPTCNICGESFTRTREFLKHVNIHKETVDVFTCRSCANKTFNTLEDFMQHKQEEHLPEHEMKEVNCKYCYKKFVTLYTLRRHLNVCSVKLNPERFKDLNIKDLTCRKCARKFKSLGNLKAHVKICGNVRLVFTCDICNKTLYMESSMLEHKRMHEEERKFFSLDEINKAENINSNLNITERIKKERKIQKGTSQDLFCKICNKLFTSLNYFQKHMTAHDEHKANPLKFQCEQCVKVFARREYLQQHMRRHFDRKFACQYCDKKFMRNKELIVHTRVHTGDRPFVCEFCGDTFRVEINFKDHLKMHQGLKYECHECGESFDRRRFLRLHSYLHTGKWPFPCCYCDLKFVRKLNYKRHLKREHGIHATEEEYLKSKRKSLQLYIVQELVDK